MPLSSYATAMPAPYPPMRPLCHAPYAPTQMSGTGPTCVVCGVRGSEAGYGARRGAREAHTVCCHAHTLPRSRALTSLRPPYALSGTKVRYAATSFHPLLLELGRASGAGGPSFGDAVLVFMGVVPLFGTYICGSTASVSEHTASIFASAIASICGCGVALLPFSLGVLALKAHARPFMVALLKFA
eukprot:2133809-Rhodomonas_salina.2